MGKPTYRPGDVVPQADAVQPGPYIEILRALAGHVRQCVILAGPFCWFDVHWVAEIGLTQPCTIATGSCAYHDEPHKRYAYATGWNPDTGRLVIPELTWHACNPYEAFCGRTAIATRGRLVKLWRKPDKPQGRVCAKVMRYEGDVTMLPPTFDLVEALVRIWNGERKKVLRIFTQPEEETA